jgi:dihydrofolate reductase
MDIVAVAAVSENGVIGAGEELPWDLPGEVERYRERVAGHTVVLGRKTFEMFEDLPGERQIVLTRSGGPYDEPSVATARSVTDAIELARMAGTPVLYVLGGAGVYDSFLPYYDRMLLSRVDGEYEGDAYFPEFDRSEWEIAAEERCEGYTLESWVRAQ